MTEIREIPIVNHGVVGDVKTVAPSVRMVPSTSFAGPTSLVQASSPQSSTPGGRFAIDADRPGTSQIQLYLPEPTVFLTHSFLRDGVAKISYVFDMTEERTAQRLVRGIKAALGMIRFA